MTAEPMVPDEAVEAAMKIAYPGLQTTGQPSYKYARKYVTRMLAAAMPALTAAARAEVAASVRAALVQPDTPDHWTVEVSAADLRAAVSDDGIANHNQQMRADGWDEGFRAGYDEAADGHFTTVPNPYRAEAAGDQHHQGGDE